MKYQTLGLPTKKKLLNLQKKRWTMDCHILIHIDRAYYTDDDDDYRDSPYCYQCIGRHENSTSYIKSYNYKPSPIFYGEGIFYGIAEDITVDGRNLESIT